MQLTKHHGLGNDFLVFLDLDGRRPVGPDEAVRVCHRGTGVGADGLIRATSGTSTDLEMILHNADGSRAEMSGNGISCLGQAALLAGAVDASVMTVTTDAGTKEVEVVARPGDATHTMRVDLGTVTVGVRAPEWTDDSVLHAVWVDVGNPHLVLHVGDHADVELETIGVRANDLISGGVNVETVVEGGSGEISMHVYERGVGLTEACGTGACASAAAAHGWGFAGDRVVVHQPGGSAVVELGSRTHYTVEVEAVAQICWPWSGD